MKTIREQTVGKSLLRLLQTGSGYAGIVITGGKSETPIYGDDAEDLWARLHQEVDRASPAYFGMEGAVRRFLKFFPEGFSGASYRSVERDYKDAAVKLLAESLPLQAAANAGEGECTAAAKVFGKTNLLSLFEQARIREVLKSADGPMFLGGAAAFTHGDLKTGLESMRRAIAPHGPPSWPILTYLPFLWQPDTHMFLKPRVTVDYAERVGDPFARIYAGGEGDEVYPALQAMVRSTREALQPLAPKDGIDIQSFIWVIGGYSDEDLAALQPEPAPASN